jgi:hypothetical protein
MPRRHVLALALLAYLSLDLSTPWLPGIFFFDHSEFFFIDTAVEGKSKPARLGTGLVIPRVIVPVRAPVAERGLLVPAAVPDARGPDGPRLRPSERSALAPSSLDDH